MLKLPRVVRTFAEVYNAAGYELYLVGGAVRDALLGVTVSDFDFASSATPEETKALFKRVIPTGIKHGTVSVPYKGRLFEVTTYRVDGDYSDSRRPDQVEYTSSLAEDLSRRDFTINAIAFNPVDRSIVDPYNGRKDLEGRIIRTVGRAEERFSEDALRMLRAIRFAAQLEFSIEANVVEAIERLGNRVERVAAERVANELRKMILAARPSIGWQIARDTGLLAFLIPELIADDSIPVDVFSHLLRSCDCTPSSDEILRWAALFHDIAKPECYSLDEKGVHFHGHDERSAEIATTILTRLRFPTRFTLSVSHLIRHHMIGYTDEWSDAAVRRLIARVGRAEIGRLIALSQADACGKGAPATGLPIHAELARRVEVELAAAPPLDRRDLAVNGRVLMDHLGISGGPVLGVIIEELYQTVLNDPETNNADTLLAIARRFVEQRLSISEDGSTSNQR